MDSLKGAAVFGTGMGFAARYFNFPGSQTISGMVNYCLGGALAGSLYGASIKQVGIDEEARNDFFFNSCF